MLPADAQPLLLDDEAGAPSPQLSRSLSASSAGRKSARKGSRAASSRDWGESSYTDLHSLASGSDDGRGEGAAPSRNALGTINGVYVPCLLNIIGVILFLRLGWGVGQAGVEGMMWIFFMAEAQAVLTVLSASTIASNGAMQGGGSYYLISRSLGPEFGGAVGLQFYFLYAVGVSMYLVGFAEEFHQTWFADAEIGKKPVVVIVATIALILILIIAIIGARAFARVNKYLFVLQFACVAIGALFIFVGSPRELKSGGEFTGMRIATLKENTPPHLTNELHICGDEACTIAGVYAIVFPLATGFMEGLNLSGDLQNPGKSIPVGTLAAVGTSCVVYITLILTFAASFTGVTLRTNFSFFQEVSDYPIVVIVGVLVSCFSSALGALFGASRILQAIARDDLFPVLKSMGQGTTVGDEPRNAVLFTAALTQVFICLGDLDVIAPICTSFFCLAYAAVNMTCFLLQVTGVPNFRPSFRHHSWQLALLGAILNIGVMIYLNALYAAVSLLALACLFFYLYVSGSPKAWGDISQALIYHQVRKYLLRLDSRKAHTKYWRPSILLLTNSIDCDEAKLCNKLKKGGLYIVGSVITGAFDTQSHQHCTNRYNEWLEHIFETKLKAIPEVIIATEAREGYRILMQSAGLGGMQINTVVVPWIEAPNDPLASKMHSELFGTQRPLDFVGLLADGIVLRRNMVIARHTDQLDRRLLSTAKSSLGDALPMLTSTSTTSKQTIDVWVTASWGDAAVSASTALLLQLAYVLYSNPQWRARTSIRLLKLSASSDAGSLQLERQQLERLAEQLRVDSHVTDLVVVPAYAAGSASPSRELLQDAAAVDEVNLALQRHSRHTALLLLPLPDPTPFSREPQAAAEYLARLTRLTASLPSTLLAWRDDDAPSVISVGI